MPLIKSGSRAAIGTNIREMQAAGHAHDQSVAAALSNARKYGGHFASGGFTPPFGERMAARGLMHSGLINSAVPGRTDKLPITVGGGAYIVPADHLAALGQGNTMAGANVMNKIFHMGPYGTAPSAMRGIKATAPRMSTGMKMPKARGGGTGHPTPIIAAGGEYTIPPDKIIEKFGSLEKGHKALDHWIVTTRKKHAKTLMKLPGPKRD